MLLNLCRTEGKEQDKTFELTLLPKEHSFLMVVQLGPGAVLLGTQRVDSPETLTHTRNHNQLLSGLPRLQRVMKKQQHNIKSTSTAFLT